jgi:hypothetical protein
MAMTGLPKFLTKGTSTLISAVSPLLEIHRTQVVGPDHAEVAVNGVGGVQEKCGGAGRVERRGDFLGYDGAFADTGDYEAPGRGGHGFHTGLKISGIVEAFGQCRSRFRLRYEWCAGQRRGWYVVGPCFSKRCNKT